MDNLDWEQGRCFHTYVLSLITRTHSYLKLVIEKVHGGQRSALTAFNMPTSQALICSQFVQDLFGIFGIIHLFCMQIIIHGMLTLPYQCTLYI